MPTTPTTGPAQPGNPSSPDATRRQPSYRVHFPTLTGQLLPVLLRRGPRLRAWLTALLSPLTQALYPDFLRLVAQARRELSYNGQTIVLEQALNDYFDPNLRRIEIRNDDVEVLPQYLYFEREGQALPALFYRSELPHQTTMQLTYQVEQRQQGFTVYAPNMQVHDAKIKAVVNRYKVALTSYRVLFVAAPPR